MNKSNIQRSKKMSPLLKLIASVFIFASSNCMAIEVVSGVFSIGNCIFAGGTVVCNGPIDEITAPVDTGSPSVTQINLLNNSGQSVLEINEGDVLDTGTLGFTNGNISVEGSNTSSIDFSLDGPAGFLDQNRYENVWRYTVGNAATGLDFVPGDYVLTSTPYRDDNKLGDAGSANILNFSIAHTVASSSSSVSGGSSSSSSPNTDVFPIAAGFTTFAPSVDTRTIYVSDSAGADTNSCLTELLPCKTVSAAFGKMRAGLPDHVKFKRGDTWTDQGFHSLKGGRSATEPAVFTYYGDSGARPTFVRDSEKNHFKQVGSPQNHIAFLGLKFQAKNINTNGEPTKAGEFSIFGGHTNVLIEDVVYRDIELKVQPWTATGSPTNIVLRRNIFDRVYSDESSTSKGGRTSNIYASKVDGLVIEENVFDYGGWHPTLPGAGGSQYSHAMYLQFNDDGNILYNNTRVENNIVARGSSHCIMGRSGGEFINNFIAKCAIGLQAGHKDTPMSVGSIGHMIGNVITEGRTMVKGADPCTNTKMCTGLVLGLTTEHPGVADFKVIDNIVHTIDPDDTLYLAIPPKWRGIGHASIDAGVETSGNIYWHFDKEGVLGDGPSYVDAGRTLSDYNESLGGSNSFDEFMDTVKARPLGTWNAVYTADSINAYIRAGFAITGE